VLVAVRDHDLHVRMRIGKRVDLVVDVELGAEHLVVVDRPE
jgi:hypothetical protein